MTFKKYLPAPRPAFTLGWGRFSFPNAFSGCNLAGQFWCHSQSTVKSVWRKIVPNRLSLYWVSVLYQGGLSGDSCHQMLLPVSVGLQEESCYRSSLHDELHDSSSDLKASSSIKFFEKRIESQYSRSSSTPSYQKRFARCFAVSRNNPKSINQYSWNCLLITDGHHRHQALLAGQIDFCWVDRR